MVLISKLRKSKPMQTPSYTFLNNIYESAMASCVYCSHSAKRQTEKVKVSRVEKTVHSVPKLISSSGSF